MKKFLYAAASARLTGASLCWNHKTGGWFWENGSLIIFDGVTYESFPISGPSPYNYSDLRKRIINHFKNNDRCISPHCGYCYGCV